MAQNPKITIITLLPRIVIFILLPMCSIVFAQKDNEAEKRLAPYVGMNISSFGYDPRVPLADNPQFLGLYMGGTRSPLLQDRLSLRKRTVEIDSTGKNINFSEKIGEFNSRVSTSMPLYDYVETRRRNYLREKFIQTTVSRLSETYSESSRGGAIRIDIPVEIKSKAFQKIFGGGTVGLDVSGEINIKGGFRNEKRSEVKTALNRGSDNTFKMEQTQRFNVGGHVGEKVTIKVDQDSERMFDFENAISLKYQGFEDEIIQSIEAGNISLSLPGTRFVTASMKSSGLFGIKTSAQIGNLKLTAIASQEKGEKKKMSLKGGAEDETARIEISRYKRGTYYFLDDYYRENYLTRTEDGVPISYTDRNIVRIEVYKSAPNYQQQFSESIRGWAWVPEEERENEQIILEGDTTKEVSSDLYRGYFLRLEKNEYYIHDQMGYIRLDTPLQENEVLAVAYEDSSGRIRGNIDYDSEIDEVIQLRLIKAKDTRPSDTTWPLEWKNVYSLGGRSIPKEGFELTIFYEPPSGDPEETVTDANGNKMTWLQAFGLDRRNLSGELKPDNIVDNSDYLINFALGEIYFPHLRPFDPSDEKLRSLLYSADPKKNKLAPAIYDTTVQSVINTQSKFYIEVKSQNKSAEYRLGMNVIDGSEEVTLNGRRLTRGVDYTIDYTFGQLRILNEQALAANANLDISYESNQLFQIDKKTVMGARAEYGLWDDSFIGATFMYLNESTLDQKIRVGKGPMRNMVWDVNTSLTVKPFFLTKLANFIPFVDTRAPSTINFEGEIAQVLPNPNTRNNKKTGDNDGVAYIDDFEAAKRITPLPIVRRGWSQCAPPLEKYPDFQFSDLSAMGRLVWYNPYSQYPIKNIWPNKDVNANVAQTTNILIVEFTAPDSLADVREAWAGIQRSLSSGYSNQTEAKYLEIWIKNNPATTGKIHIDIGQISEDIIPNQELDTEDELKSGIRNGLLDEGEDIGLDGMGNNSPVAQAAGGDFWDINGNKQKDYGEPYSFDDWEYDPTDPKGGYIDYSKTNGTERNENDSGGRIPDSEDMNGNGDVDLRNDYYSFTINLNHDHEDYKNYVIGESISKETGEDFGWRLYQIPLNAPEPTRQVFGSPDISKVEYIRLWMDGFSTTDKQGIWIAEINLVGSDWKEKGIAAPERPDEYEVDDDSTVTISVVNTHDNDDYRPPPGVEGEVDRITRVIAKEQSLVLRVNGLQPGYSGKVQKTFYDAQDYIHYNTMKMFVFGRDDYASHITDDSSHIEFFLRFGADENNYYEIREKVFDGWGKNTIEVDLVKLSQIKESGSQIIYLNGSELRQVIVDGKMWRVRGDPALRNIKMLEAGVINMHPTDPFRGEIYINELRLSDVKKDKGIAMRARMDFAWADIIRFNGEVNRMDADFHNVAERFGSGDNQFSGQFAANVSVDKFLPSKLGLSLPVSVNYSTSNAEPKYVPGTDIQVRDNNGNINVADSTFEKIITKNDKRGMSVSLGINSKSQNFLIKHIITPFKANYSRNEGTGSNSRTEYSNSTSESGGLSWGLLFGRDNYIRPFKFLGESRFLAKVSDIKLYYSPQNITTKLSGSRNSSESKTRTGVVSENSAFNITRGVSGSMKILESLSIDVSRDYNNDLRDVPEDSLWTLFKNFKFGLLTSVDQNSSIKYDPKFFSWLTTNFNYSVNFKYGYNRQQRVGAKSTTQGTSISANGTLNLGTLAKTIYKPTTGRGRTATTRARPNTPDQNTATNANAKKEKKLRIPVMSIFSKFFEIFDPFSLKYTDRKNMTIYGLSGIPQPRFQFGLTDDIGVPFEVIEESQGTATNRDARSQNETFGVSSGLSFSRDIKLSFNFDKSFSINKSTSTTGQRSVSWLVWGEDTSVPFPTWTLRVNGMEKLPLLKNWFQRVTLEHGRAGKADETFSVEKGEQVTTKEDKDSQFRPLIGMQLQMKNGISISVRYNTSEKESITRTSGQAGTRTTSQDLSVSANYSKKGDFRIPLPFLGRKRLQNAIDIALTFTLGNNVTLKSRGEGYEVTAETSKWIFKPTVDYSFSNRVRGGAYFEIGKTHNKLIGDTTFKELGINVTISIRGN